MSPSTRAVVSLCANSSGDSFHSGLMTVKEALSLYGIFSHFILRFEVSRQCIDVDKLTRRHFCSNFHTRKFTYIRAIRAHGFHAKHERKKIKPKKYPLLRRYGMAACFSLAHPSKSDSSPQTMLKASSTALYVVLERHAVFSAREMQQQRSGLLT